MIILFIIVGIGLLIFLIHISEIKLNSILTPHNLIMLLLAIFTIIFVYWLLTMILPSAIIVTIYDKMLVLLLSVSVALIIDGILTDLITSIYEKYEINKYEKNNSFTDYTYYRDIIKNVKPAILLYCYNRKYDIDDAVIITLLNLKINNFIKIEDNNIKILENKKKLTLHEKLVLEYIKRDYNFDMLKEKFDDKLKEDMEKDGFIKKLYDEMNIIMIMDLFIIWLILYSLVIIPGIFGLNDYGYISFPYFIFITYFFAFIAIPFYKKINKNINPIARTEKALEQVGKLKGLKNFILDFSILQDRNINDIQLYEDYIIYTIILNVPGNLNNECKELYKNIKNSKHKDNVKTNK